MTRTARLRFARRRRISPATVRGILALAAAKPRAPASSARTVHRIPKVAHTLPPDEPDPPPDPSPDYLPDAPLPGEDRPDPSPDPEPEPQPAYDLVSPSGHAPPVVVPAAAPAGLEAEPEPEPSRRCPADRPRFFPRGGAAPRERPPVPPHPAERRTQDAAAHLRRCGHNVRRDGLTGAWMVSGYMEDIDDARLVEIAGTKGWIAA
jgi:hypothetical protein